MALSEQAKEARRAYRREWRKKNPGKEKEYAERYWNKKGAKLEASAEEQKEQQPGA